MGIGEPHCSSIEEVVRQECIFYGAGRSSLAMCTEMRKVFPVLAGNSGVVSGIGFAGTLNEI